MKEAWLLQQLPPRLSQCRERKNEKARRMLQNHLQNMHVNIKQRCASPPNQYNFIIYNLYQFSSGDISCHLVETFIILAIIISITNQMKNVFHSIYLPTAPNFKYYAKLSYYILWIHVLFALGFSHSHVIQTSNKICVTPFWHGTQSASMRTSTILSELCDKRAETRSSAWQWAWLTYRHCVPTVVRYNYCTIFGSKIFFSARIYVFNAKLTKS